MEQKYKKLKEKYLKWKSLAREIIDMYSLVICPGRDCDAIKSWDESVQCKGCEEQFCDECVWKGLCEDCETKSEKI